MSKYNSCVAVKANTNKTESSVVLVVLTIIVIISMALHKSHDTATEVTSVGQEIHSQ
ncbi:MAG: hypothetical protein ABL933_02125 [Methyloglobulus sp.]